MSVYAFTSLFEGVCAKAMCVRVWEQVTKYDISIIKAV